MVERGDELYTSALTVGEILIKPLEAGDEVLARRYESALLQGAVIIPFDVEPARLYASICKDRTIRPPDAIQLACASHARVDLFITNGAAQREINSPDPIRQFSAARILVSVVIWESSPSALTKNRWIKPVSNPKTQ